MAGRITDIRVQKKNQDRVSVYVDGRFAFGLPAIVGARLKPGDFLSDVEIASLQADGAVEVAYNQALNYLSFRPRSRAEVASYLRGRQVADHHIEATVERLEQAGLLDDEAFATFWIENREQFRPRGPRALRHELRAKGIDDAIVDNVLAGVDVEDSAYRAAAQKARQWAHLDQQTFLQKLVAYLARRGFDYDVAQEAAARWWSQRDSVT